MLKSLPQKFFACGCESTGSSPGVNPAANCPGATICNDAYFNLAAGPRLNLIGVAPSSNCQIKLTSARGFVFDDGLSAGQFITNSPQVTMPALNPGTVGAWTEGTQWPVLCAATGVDPHSWRFVYAPSAGSWRLETENGNFKFVSATTIPGVNGVCSQNTSVEKIRPFGCFVADATVENPAWALRRLGLFDKSLLVSFVDGAGNAWVKCLNPATDTFEYPGTVLLKTVKYQNLIAVDNAGAPIPGGLPVLDRTVVADAVIGYFSPTTGLFYRSPAHVRQVKSSTANVSLTLNTGFQTYSNHGQFDPAVILHKSVEINVCLVFSTQEQFQCGLHRDGILIHTWDFDVNAQPNNAFSMSFIDINVPQGSHTYDLRFKIATGTNATTMYFSTCTLKTLTD